MPRLLGLKIKNYKSLVDVSLGQTEEGKGDPIPPLSCFIGPNGSGKSNLLDAFGFMADCLREGIEAACDKPQRGGFSKLRTQGSTQPILFTLHYRETSQSPAMTYSFSIGQNNGIPFVIEESLQGHGHPNPYLHFKNGRGRIWVMGSAWLNEVNLQDAGRLGLAAFGNLKEQPAIAGLLAYMESWYLSYFVPDAARKLPSSGAQKHLDRTGENLGNVVQYLEVTYPNRFKSVLDDIAKKIPGVRSISHTKSPDGRLLLSFNESGYADPFYQQSMSDGTLKLFAYLLLLNDPEPRPFIGIEEPENGLYHKLLEGLAREFLRQAEQSQENTQILVTTHSPYFVDALKPEQVWLMEKDESGATQARRTADMPVISAMVKEGIPLGSLWYSNHFDERFG
jgi:predicted ATPase